MEARIRYHGVRMANTIAWQEDPESLVARYVERPSPELKDLILTQYANLVERVARKFSGLEQQDDLLQVGFIGLLNALGKFDPNAGVRFNTYATYLVAGEIKHYLRDRSQIIRHPAWLQELRHKVNRTSNMLSQTLGRQPTDGEIAEQLGVSETSVREVHQTQELLKVASLDATPSDDDGESDADRLDAAEYCPEQLGFEDRMVLEQAMRQLRDLERQVLIHFHFDAMNQTEIAAKLNISCNYVSHILRQSLGKLRRILTMEEHKDEMLRRQAEYIDFEVIDSATSVYSEAYFNNRFEEELHRASGSDSELGLALIEFSGLERLRAFYGEDSVIDFLSEAGQFLRDTVRRLDVVCRRGETGFAVILPATGIHASIVQKRLVDRLNSWMKQRFAATSTVFAEVGQASFPADSKTTIGLIEAATNRMHDVEGWPEIGEKAA